MTECVSSNPRRGGELGLDEKRTPVVAETTNVNDGDEEPVYEDASSVLNSDEVKIVGADPALSGAVEHDNLIKISRLNSLHSLSQNSSYQATLLSQNTIQQAASHRSAGHQLSRNSSTTFSSKSHYSLRSNGTSKRTSNSAQKQPSFPHRPSPLIQTVVSGTTGDNASIGSSSSASIYSLTRGGGVGGVGGGATTDPNLNAIVANSDAISQIINMSLRDPILIRGSGNITIFGVCNKFNEQFPTQLTAKLAPEEFRDTIKQINNILTKELANSFKWLVFGSVFCCCTLGCSFLPVIFMNKKAKLSINKLLDMENQRLYLKLGLKWRLTKMKCNANSLLEYVLLIEFLPTLLLYQPD